jgi:hypothetical protein
VMPPPVPEGGGARAVRVAACGPVFAGPMRGAQEGPRCRAQREDWEKQIGAGRVKGEGAACVAEEQRRWGGWCAFLLAPPSALGRGQRVDDRKGTGKEPGGALEACGLVERFVNSYEVMVAYVGIAF